jgi:hypothetical protein
MLESFEARMRTASWWIVGYAWSFSGTLGEKWRVRVLMRRSDVRGSAQGLAEARQRGWLQG